METNTSSNSYPNSDQNGQNPSSSSTSLSDNRNDARPPAGLGGGIHPGFMGKHRMAAAIAFLDQQINIIQEEIDQLDTLGEASTVCKELLASVESIPDALLPETKAPIQTDWDRWFQGGHGSKNRKRWI